MANNLDPDCPRDDSTVPRHGSLLSSDDQLLAGIRVTRAQFAKMMGCSRQAVTDWVQSGRVVVGPDGRFDPRKAVADLLRTGDPARLRARVLQPLAEEISAYRARIVALEAALGESLMKCQDRCDVLREQVEFAEGANEELLEIFRELTVQLPCVFTQLAEMPGDGGAKIIVGWLETAMTVGVGDAGSILTRIRMKEGEGEEHE